MKALIAYGTKYGSTAEVAATVQQELVKQGYQVDVLDLRHDDGRGVSGYDLVVLGSAVFVGKWTKQAQVFIEKNARDLASTKVAMFVTCSDVLFPEKVEAARKLYLEDVAAAIPGCVPVSTALFGGVIDFNRYSALTRFLLAGVGTKKTLRSRGVDIATPYDYRDWDQIKSWARSL